MSNNAKQVDKPPRDRWGEKLRARAGASQGQGPSQHTTKNSTEHHAVHEEKHNMKMLVLMLMMLILKSSPLGLLSQSAVRGAGDWCDDYEWRPVHTTMMMMMMMMMPWVTSPRLFARWLEGSHCYCYPFGRWRRMGL